MKPSAMIYARVIFSLPHPLHLQSSTSFISRFRFTTIHRHHRFAGLDSQPLSTTDRCVQTRQVSHPAIDATKIVPQDCAVTWLSRQGFAIITKRTLISPSNFDSSSTSKMNKRRKSKHDRLPLSTPRQVRIDIARSNSTLKTFLPGRQRSWLAAGVAAHAFPGPQPLANSTGSASAANEPQAMSASGPTVVPLLPWLPAPLRRQAPSSTVPAPPAREPRLQSAPTSAGGTPSLLPSVDVSRNNPSRMITMMAGAADISAAQPDTTSLTDTIDLNLSRPMRTVDSPSSVPHGSPTDDRTLQALPPDPTPAPAPSALPRQRPRPVATAASTGQASPPSKPYTAANTWAPRLTVYFATCDHHPLETSLAKHVRDTEINYLYQACILDDRFYIALHQLYCLYTVRPSAVRRLPGHSLDHEVGLAILPMMLGVRDALSPQHLDWLSSFPMDITALWNLVPGFNQTFPIVQAFLRALGLTFPALNNGCGSRGFPPLVHELVTGMGAKSGLMQVRLFVTVRNLMWGNATLETMRLINEIFKRDQDAYYRSLAGMGTSSPVTIPQAHRNHATTISEYRQLRDRLKDSRRPDGSRELSPLGSFDETPYRNLVPDIRRFNFLRFNAQPWSQMSLMDPQARTTLDASILAYLQRAPPALTWSQGLQLFTRPLVDASGVDHNGTSRIQPGLQPHIPQHGQTTQPGTPPPLQQQHRTSGAPPGFQIHPQHNGTSRTQPGPQPHLHQHDQRSAQLPQNQSQALPLTESGVDTADQSKVRSRSQPCLSPGRRQLYPPPAPLTLPSSFSSRPSTHSTTSVPPARSTQASSPLTRPTRETPNVRQAPIPLPGSETSSAAYTAQARNSPTADHGPPLLPDIRPPAPPRLPTREPPTAHQANPALPGFRSPAPLRLPCQTRELPDATQATSALLGSDPPAPSIFPSHHHQDSFSASQLTAAALLGRDVPVSARSGRDHQPDRPADPSGRSNPTVTALHQAHLNRQRVGHATGMTDDGDGGGEARLFPSVVAFALEPARTRDTYSMSQTPKRRTFVLDDDDWDRVKGVVSRCQETWQSTVTITEKAIDFRLRCCRVPSNESDRAEPLTDWLGREHVWPRRIYVTVNGRGVDIPRKRHHGRDLPLDITPLLRQGENVVNVFVSTTVEDEDRLPAWFTVAVERVEYRTHREIMAAVAERPPVDLDMIGLDPNTNRTAHGGGVIDLTQEHTDVLLTTETVIGIRDPHSSRMWEVPVRSTECKHHQCFDLKTFLDTRPPQPATVTPTNGKLSLSPAGGQPDMFPAGVDSWKCPFCDCDARPDMLRRSKFFEDVRRKLVQEDQQEEGEGATQRKKQLGHVRSVLIRSDGSWQIREANDVEQSPVVIQRLSVDDRRDRLPRSHGIALVDIDIDGLADENTRPCDAHHATAAATTRTSALMIQRQRDGRDDLRPAANRQGQVQGHGHGHGHGQGQGQGQGRKGKGRDRIVIEID